MSIRNDVKVKCPDQIRFSIGDAIRAHGPTKTARLSNVSEATWLAAVCSYPVQQQHLDRITVYLNENGFMRPAAERPERGKNTD